MPDAAAATAAAQTIRQGVPCTRCGYDLRGLPHGGLCPECAQPVEWSVTYWVEREEHRAAVLRTDPRWLRLVAEGALLSLVAFVLLVALAAAPGWAFDWNTPQRCVTLGAACAMWVLSWAAAWKLTTPEPGPQPPRSRGRRVLRAFATMYVAVPFIAGLAPAYNAGIEFIAPLLVCVAAGIIAAVAWFVRVGQLAARVGSRSLPVEARLLAVCNGVSAILLLAPRLDAPEDSLSHLLSAHIVPFGSAEWIHETLAAVEQGIIPHPIEWVAGLLVVWSAAVSLRLLVLLRRAARAAESAKMRPTDEHQPRPDLGAADPQAP